MVLIKLIEVAAGGSPGNPVHNVCSVSAQQAPVSALSSLFVYFLSVSLLRCSRSVAEVVARFAQVTTDIYYSTTAFHLMKASTVWLLHESLLCMWLLWDGY